MSKRIYITKEEAIIAVLSEPLKAGNWQNSDGCSVCAVGAILRGKNVEPRAGWEATDGEYRSYESFRGALKKGNYLGALSIYFERMILDDAGNINGPVEAVKVTTEHRKKLYRFINRHFPKRVSVTVADHWLKQGA